MKKPKTVYVVTIEHRHGIDTYVCATNEGAWKQLHDYVKEWWESEAVPGEIPEHPPEAVRDYFDHVETEFYGLEETLLRP
jgi:hypothetical protein